MNITFNTDKNTAIVQGNKFSASTKAELVKAITDTSFKRSVKKHCPETGTWFFAIQTESEVAIMAVDNYMTVTGVTKATDSNKYFPFESALRAGNKKNTVTLNTKKTVRPEVKETSVEAQLRAQLVALEEKLAYMTGKVNKQSEIIADVLKAETLEEAKTTIRTRYTQRIESATVTYTEESMEATVEASQAFRCIEMMAEGIAYNIGCVSAISEIATTEEEIADINNKMFDALELAATLEEFLALPYADVSEFAAEVQAEIKRIESTYDYSPAMKLYEAAIALQETRV